MGFDYELSMENRCKLLIDVEKYLAARSVMPREFGVEAMGDSRFVYEMRNGRVPGAKTEECVRHYMLTGKRMFRRRGAQ